MNKSKSLILSGLYLFMFHACSASHVDTILNKETFTTFEEKIELFQALGIEYTNEVIVSKDLYDHLSRLAQTTEAQKAFSQHDYYQLCMSKSNEYQTIAQDRSVMDTMIIKKINPTIGYGVIAGCKIKMGTTLGLYAGQLKFTSDSKDEDYIFGCNSIIPGCPELTIDARHKGNELRFINGSQHHSNCEARNFLVPTGEKRCIYYATADIEEGQEILADYGDFYWASYRKHQYQELGIAPKKVQSITANQKQSESSFGKGFKKGFLDKKK